MEVESAIESIHDTHRCCFARFLPTAACRYVAAKYKGATTRHASNFQQFYLTKQHFAPPPSRGHRILRDSHCPYCIVYGLRTGAATNALHNESSYSASKIIDRRHPPFHHSPWKQDPNTQIHETTLARALPHYLTHSGFLQSRLLPYLEPQRSGGSWPPGGISIIHLPKPNLENYCFSGSEICPTRT